MILANSPAELGPIPASAGETASRRKLHEDLWAYPRERGGNEYRKLHPLVLWGLSPRARGKHSKAAQWTAEGGPIPASAGETAMCCMNWGISGAYPRERGGNLS